MLERYNEGIEGTGKERETIQANSLAVNVGGM